MKIKKIINEHKSLAIIGILALILLIIMTFIFINLLLGGNKDKYGDRLEGIKEVKLTNSFFDELEAKVKETAKVDEVSARVQGKIVYITITFNKDIALGDAKSVAESTLVEFSEEELAFYDLEYIITRVKDTDNAEDVGYVAMGTKHPQNEKISWTKS